MVLAGRSEWLTLRLIHRVDPFFFFFFSIIVLLFSKISLTASSVGSPESVPTPLRNPNMKLNSSAHC
jgi:hypothetical protein